MFLLLTVNLSHIPFALEEEKHRWASTSDKSRKKTQLWTTCTIQNAIKKLLYYNCCICRNTEFSFAVWRDMIILLSILLILSKISTCFAYYFCELNFYRSWYHTDKRSILSPWCVLLSALFFPSSHSRVSSPLHIWRRAVVLLGLSNTLGDRAANAPRALLWHLRWAGRSPALPAAGHGSVYFPRENMETESTLRNGVGGVFVSLYSTYIISPK